MNISKQISSQVASYCDRFAWETSVQQQLDQDHQQSSSRSPSCWLQAGNLQRLNEKLRFSQFCSQHSEISCLFLKKMLFILHLAWEMPQNAAQIFKSKVTCSSFHGVYAQAFLQGLIFVIRKIIGQISAHIIVTAWIKFKFIWIK